MSDRPVPPPDEQSEERGQWHAPQTPQIWRPVQPSAPPPSVRVPALPSEMQPEPEARGQWHWPSPKDTSFSEADVIEMPTTKMTPVVSSGPALEISPEDMIAQIVGGRKTGGEALTRPEDAILELQQEEAQRPEDFEMGGLDALADLGADDDAFSVSEYVALAALEREGAHDEQEPAVALDPEDLSPAARAALVKAAVEASELIEPSTSSEEKSAADIAAEMAARLAGEASEEPVVPQEGGQKSAADIAAEMAARLAGDSLDEGTPIPSGTQPMPAPTSSLTPEERALAQRFDETQRQVRVLRQQYRAGQLSYDQLQAQLRQFTILDERDQTWWMLGVESDHWYRFDKVKNEWVQSEPPVPLGLSSPRTETSSLDPNEVIAGSLPYLPDSSGQVREYSDPNAATMGLDPYGDSGTPVPRPGQPQFDPNLTMVGQSWDVDSLGTSEPTIQGMQPLDATMPSPSVYGGASYPSARLESAVDRSAPPSYDLNVDAPIYEAQRQAERNRTQRIIVMGLVALLACGLISGIIAFGGMMLWYNQQVEPYRAAIAGLADYQPAFQTARILDANGDLIVELNSREGGARQVVTLNEISPYLVHAVLSTENRSFYDDAGFAFDRIVGAFLQNLSSDQIVSGASTVTQQIARNLLLGTTEVTAQRKVQEILLAMEISNNYDKNFILELYLNEFFFGNQSYGVEAASRFYFDKRARDLNMAESAMLAGLIQGPAANDPVVNREAAMRAMRNSIRLMVETGCLQFQHGTWAQTNTPFCVNERSTAAFNGEEVRLFTLNPDGSYGGLLALQLAEVETRAYQPRQSRFRYPHFVNYIQAQVEADFGPDAMFQRGFTIYTTLIPRIQDVAEQTLRDQVRVLVNNGVNTGAVMVTDPQSGAIRAMVGSPDFSNEQIAGQVDNTRTWQQPGSAIKAVVYTAALEGGPNGYLTPASILWDVQSRYNINGQIYEPVNFRRNYNGPVPLRFALQNSLNIPAVKAYEFIGSDRYVETARRMGLNFLPDTLFGLPSALGANDVRLIDMMKAYGTLANNGIFVNLHAIERITEDSGGQILDVPLAARPEPAQAVSPQIAYLMQNILSDDASRAQEFGVNGNLTLARLNIPTQNYVAAKTGTSDGGRDLWTLGFTSNTVVGVWLGTFDNAQTVGVTGFTAAAPVWNRVLEAAIAGRAPGMFQNPGGVIQQTVCRETGTLASDNCPTRLADLALQNQPPPAPDAGFVQSINIDSWTGLRANQWCQENVVAQTFANISDPFAVNWINTTPQGQNYARLIGLPSNLQTPPQNECQQGQTLPSVRINNPADGQTLTGTVTITGQISAPDFARYELLYSVDGSNFQSIGPASNQQFPAAGSTIGTWDTSLLPNGTYTLRLAAFSSSGGYIFRDVRVTTSNVPPTPTPAPTATPTPPVVEPPVQPLTPGFTPIPFDPLNPTPTLAL